MFPRGILNENTKRGKRIKVTADAITRLVHADPAKAVVMTYFRRLVTDGHAEWHMLGNGDIELCFRTGEIYRLAKATITRVA